MVCKIKFVRYDHIKKLTLYVPWFNSDGPLKSEVSISKIELFHFQALDPKFVLALKPIVLKQEGSSCGIGPSICVLNGGYKERQRDKGLIKKEMLTKFRPKCFGQEKILVNKFFDPKTLWSKKFKVRKKIVKKKVHLNQILSKVILVKIDLKERIG